MRAPDAVSAWANPMQPETNPIDSKAAVRPDHSERVIAAARPRVSETGRRVDALKEWRSGLTAIVGGLMLYLLLSGLAIFLLPFGEFTQFSVLVHTLIGIVAPLPIIWYSVRHWRVRRGGNLSHYQLLGYIALTLLALCVISGFIVTWQGWVGPRISPLWDMTHLVSGIASAAFIGVHLATVIVRKIRNPDALRALRTSRRKYYSRSVLTCGLLMLVSLGWMWGYEPPAVDQAFPSDYNWRFGDDRPFAPSLARLDSTAWRDDVNDRILDVLPEASHEEYLAAFEKAQSEPIGLHRRVLACLDEVDADEPTRAAVARILEDSTTTLRSEGAIDERALAGSAGCGTSGCHQEIYKEWLPSAHRYSALDDMFQKVQTLMAEETSPEHTRYCAGCHDPISLFSGSKDTGNITLSAHGADEGSSCLVCHSITQTDVQGNGDYTIEVPRRYVYEYGESTFAKSVSDFLIRTYPTHHTESYSRPLYKTPEFCGACHKQYIDQEVNTDIGKVQGQNQYDSWKNSRWYHEGDPERTVSCRECHMPLVDSDDPAMGDRTDYNRDPGDGKHRSHSMLASNQYIPLLHDLKGAEEHVRLIEAWMRGEIEIPEIADKWTTGPVVRLQVDAPKTAAPGEEVAVRIILINNKTGHDFPTGPLDMIESWVELKVTDEAGQIVYHAGALDDDGNVTDPPVIFKADGFDRKGELIDRHNLWDLVGASYKRSMYPGMTDTVESRFQCPSMARGRLSPNGDRLPPGQRREEYNVTAPETVGVLHVSAVLWYRKANPEFMDRVYGSDEPVRSPATAISEGEATIEIINHGQASIQ